MNQEQYFEEDFLFIRNFYTGQDKKVFLENEKGLDDFICVICRNIFNNPVNDECGHNFCKDCISHEIEECPLSRKFYFQDPQVFPINLTIKNHIESKRCNCYNKDLGCKWEGIIEKLNKHAMACEFELKKCKWRNCEHICEQRQIKEHEQNCKYNLVFCKQNSEHQVHPASVKRHHANCPDNPVNFISCKFKCGSLIPSYDIKQHQKNYCELRKVKCWNLGCRKKIQAKYLDNHANSCRFRTIYCKYGQHWMRAMDEKNHCKDCKKKCYFWVILVILVLLLLILGIAYLAYWIFLFINNSYWLKKDETLLTFKWNCDNPYINYQYYVSFSDNKEFLDKKIHEYFFSENKENWKEEKYWEIIIWEWNIYKVSLDYNYLHGLKVQYPHLFMDGFLEEITDLIQSSNSSSKKESIILI